MDRRKIFTSTMGPFIYYVKALLGVEGRSENGKYISHAYIVGGWVRKDSKMC